MSARQKLNQLHVNGSLVLAAIVGWLSESWALFAVAAAFLLALSLCSKEIRFARQPRWSRDNRGAPGPSRNPMRAERTRKGEET